MGSKQSKRSVDISGKEGEVGAAGAGEVAAAGGEGRVEPLADVDTLKPQLNGDTPHIQPPDQISEKEKQLENGTPENEKDATTEKETVVTNGSGGEEDKPEQENGDAKPTPEAENKKNKKEKVKKKWSLRSISFSRKDKPKQEKKQKEDEPKTNGETDKLPEEGTDANAVVESKSSEDVKDVVVAAEENKDEKTPETPVTEPITNGSSAPETPKEEAPAKDDSPVPSPTIEKLAEEAKASEQPEKLPINGLSLEDVKEEVTEIKTVEAAESKVEETPAPASEEPASTPDIPVKSEVCVGQSPLKELTPPPLPANPPPSSVTAFAETTMAPHLVDASLTPGSETSPNRTATADVTPAVEDVPFNSTVDQISQNVILQLSNPLNDVAVDTNAKLDKLNEANVDIPSEMNPAKNVANEDESKELESKAQDSAKAPLIEDIIRQEEEQLQIENMEVAIEESNPIISNGNALVDTADSSESKVVKNVSDNVDDSIAENDNLKETVDVNPDTQNVTTNGDHKENDVSQKKDLIEETNTIVKTVSSECSLQSSVSVVNNIAETNSKDAEKMNGSSIETELPIANETIPLPSQPESSPVTLSNNAEEASPTKSEETKSASSAAALSEALLPPAPLHEDACESSEENRGSNEEMSESFPLPPSDLCPSESEVSGPATPEPPQEIAPVVEKSAEISVPEILAEKTLIADITVGVVAPTEGVATGAGDGAPSD